MRKCQTKNHSRKNSHNCFCLYTVYNEKDGGFPVIVDGTAKECAKAMGITLTVFYVYHSRPTKKWYIEKRFIDEEVDNESVACERKR